MESNTETTFIVTPKSLANTLSYQILGAVRALLLLLLGLILSPYFAHQRKQADLITKMLNEAFSGGYNYGLAVGQEQGFCAGIQQGFEFAKAQYDNDGKPYTDRWHDL